VHEGTALTLAIETTTSANGRTALERLRRQGCILLIGSGISASAPTSLPAGGSLTGAIAVALAARTGDRQFACKALSKAAFEYLMDGCPRLDTLGENLARLFGSVDPNPLHQAVAAALNLGSVRHVVTTNYDANLEEACRRELLPTQTWRLVVEPSDLAGLTDDQSVIFKIHGCAVRDLARIGSPRTMVYALQEEGELLDWKRALLRRLASNGTLLVAGYSGRDFEICPELSHLRVKVVWNGRCEPGGAAANALTANARRVLTETGGMLLVGDMAEVLSVLADRTVPTPTTSPFPAASGVRATWRAVSSGLTSEDIQLWRATALNALGDARDANVAARRLLPAPGRPAEAFARESQIARSMFHGGLYRQALGQYEAAARVAQQESARAASAAEAADWRKRRLEMRVLQVSAYRCYGSWLRARRALRALQVDAGRSDSWLRAQIAIQWAMLWRHPYQVARFMHLAPIARRYQDRARRQLRIVAEWARGGRWHDLQQAELWARYFDIPFAEIYSGPMTPLPSRSGYAHFGYVVANSMALRESLERPASDVVESEVSDALGWLSSAGANPEFWKLLVVAMRRRPTSRSWRPWVFPAIRAWRQCEYALPMRVLLTMFP
jgi:hypothetical protein